MLSIWCIRFSAMHHKPRRSRAFAPSPASDYQLQECQEGSENTHRGISKNLNVLKGRKRRGLANWGAQRATLLCTLVCNFSPSKKSISSSEHFSQYCNKNIAQNPVLRFNPRKKSNENEERERESHHLWNTTGHPKHGTWPTPITCCTTTTRR